MIKANELRIGNLISLQGKEITVNLNTLERLLYPELKKHYNFLGQYKPVSITAEQLIKVGFEKDNDNVLKLGNCFYWLHNGDAGIFQIAIGYAPVINSPCTYVHQLQNIYFALKGVELPGF